MDLTQLINNPQQMNRETLYELRSLLALHPYYQTARLLMLQNLYLLHDSSFDAELRKSAVYFNNRKVLFDLVEAAHYALKKDPRPTPAETDGDRTIALINDFLDSIPQEEQAENTKKRKPTPADATVDYVSYLIETEQEEKQAEETAEPQMKGQSLIDNFIQNEHGKIKLKEKIDYTPENMAGNEENDDEEGIFTETLAKIYIKQGRYDKALEIIQRLNLIYPKKNAYFADQIRFLEKLILNNKQIN